MIFPESGICGLIFPKTLSNFINNYYQENGIKVLKDEMVINVTKQDKNYLVETKGIFSPVFPNSTYLIIIL